MKQLLYTFFLLAVFTTGAYAQSKIPALDKSPMDLSSYPANYAGLRAQGKTVDPLLVRVIYSRPQKNNRVIFGELLEYNTVWRFGANENTEIEFFKDARINNVKIKKGRYSMHAIPAADKWTIIINSDLDNWGAYKYDSKKDVVRVDVPVQKTTEVAESFYIYFDKAADGITMNAGWDDVKVALPIMF